MATAPAQSAASASPSATAFWTASRRGGLRARLAAGLALVAASWLLVFGVVQDESRDPFAPPGLDTRLLAPEPHAWHDALPVRPVGSRSSLLPKELCAASDAACPGLGLGAGGVAWLANSQIGGESYVARLRHGSALAAVTDFGRVHVWSASRSSWREIAPPSPSQQPSQQQKQQQQMLEAKGSSAGPDPAAGEQPLAVLRGHEGGVRAVAWGPEGRLASAGDDATVRVWDPAAGDQPLAVLRGHEGAVFAVAWGPEGRLASAGLDGTVRVWDPAKGEQPLAVLRGHEGWVNAVAWGPEGRLASAGFDGTVRVWDPAAGDQPLAVLRGREGEVSAVAWGPEGRLASASDDARVRVWDPARGWPPLAQLCCHGDGVQAVAWGPEGRLASASDDGTVRVWDPAKGDQPLAVLRGHEGEVNAAAWGPDGRLASASNDGTVRVWDPAKGDQPLAVLRGHEGRVLAVAWGPEGRLASAGFDGTVRVWDLGGVAARDVAMADGGAAWAVGTRGYLARSDDNGGSWQLESTDTSADLESVAVAAGTVLVVGASGTVLRHDGKGWQPVATEAGARTLREVRLLDALNGWAVGEDGLILRTTDGGENWTKLHEVPGLTLEAVHVQPANGGEQLGWAVGRRADGPLRVVMSRAAGEPGSWKELPHGIAPWWFALLGFVAPALGGLNVWLWRRLPEAAVDSIAGKGVADNPLGWRDADALGLKPLALSLSRFLRNLATTPPLTLAVTGRWGSGKSSLMGLLRQELGRRGAATVWFNAWHHREEQHLFAALMEAIRSQAVPPWWRWPGLSFRLRLLWARSRGLVWAAIAALVFVLVILLIVWIGLGDTRETAWARLQRDVAAWVAPPPPAPEGAGEAGTPAEVEEESGWLAWLSELPGKLPVGGSIVTLLLAGVVWLVRARLVAFPTNPAALMAELSNRTSLRDFRDKLGFRSEFGQALGEVARALRTPTSAGLVIFIDDLDRCQPEDVMKLLEAINFVVSAGPCVVVLGMDRHQVEHSIGLGFDKLVEGLSDEELQLEPGTAADGTQRRKAFARLYLEKLINIEVPVPTVSDAGAARLLGAAADAPEQATAADEPPPWVGAVKGGLKTAVDLTWAVLVAVAIGFFTLYVIGQRDAGPAGPPPSAGPAPRATEQRTVGTPPEAATQDTAPAEVVTFEPYPPLVAQAPKLEDLPGDGRWLLWLPTLMLLTLFAAWMIVMVLRREQAIVRDSPDFAKALAAVRPLLQARYRTPRGLKRWQNRMRYLAERLRPEGRDVDALDRLLAGIGRWRGQPWAKADPSAETPPMPIDEPALILLGAMEAALPSAFAPDAPGSMHDLKVKFDGMSASSGARQELWSGWLAARTAYVDQSIDNPRAWPTDADLALYLSLPRPGT